MNQSLIPIVEGFAGLRVMVVGDAMLDVFVRGASTRLCREAPVPVVAQESRTSAPGGAANTAANAAALGAPVRMLAAAGDDGEAVELRSALEAAGVDCGGLLAVPGRRTLTKTRVSAGSQLLLRLDGGTTSPIMEPDDARLAAAVRAAGREADVCIVSDYGYGVVGTRVFEAIAGWRRRGRFLVVDAKDLARYRELEPDAVKPNFEEVSRLVSIDAHVLRGRAASESVRELGEEVLRATGAKVAAVTIDSEGAVAFEPGRPPYRTYATPFADSRATGAGDTFTAALALALAARAGTPAAAEIASAAAGVVVRKEGTCCCAAAELRDALSGGGKVVGDAVRLAQRLSELRRAGSRTVFTNGCFDIIHSGHVAYLNAAKALGDVLVVGVNSDESVRRLKGPQRPINSLADRLQILAALSSIDFLIPFEEDSPAKIIEAVRPDVFAKGGDYAGSEIPEAALVESLGGAVHVLAYVDDRSTTRLIGRIREAAAT